MSSGRIMRAIPQLLPETDAFVEVAQDTGSHAPNVALRELHRIVFADDALPVAAVQRVILRVHQEGERHLEGLVDLGMIERDPIPGIDSSDRGQDAKAAERQIKVEMSDRIDQAGVEADLLLRLAQR